MKILIIFLNFQIETKLFFAFVGFDAVACSAEEAANPKSDVPFGMIASLATVTILYTATSIVLTLMVNFEKKSFLSIFLQI